jgi:hypothetical protein
MPNVMTEQPETARADVPEPARRARQMYREGVEVGVIARETGLSTGALYYWIAGGPRRRGVTLLPALPKRRLAMQRRMLAEQRLALVERMMIAAEHQVCAIEVRLTGSGQEPAARERDARTLAVLVKTMQALVALEAMPKPDAMPGKKTITAPDDDDDDTIPADIDVLRRELSQRLEAMAAADAAGIPRPADE